MKNICATMIYDENCQFCIRWVTYWQRPPSFHVVFQPYQAGIKQFPRLSLKACQQAIQRVEKDGQVYAGAAAIFKFLSTQSKKGAFCWRLYQTSVIFKGLTDSIYKIIANNRSIFSRISLFNPPQI